MSLCPCCLCSICTTFDDRNMSKTNCRSYHCTHMHKLFQLAVLQCKGTMFGTCHCVPVACVTYARHSMIETCQKRFAGATIAHTSHIHTMVLHPGQAYFCVCPLIIDLVCQHFDRRHSREMLASQATFTEYTDTLQDSISQLI